MQVCSRCFYTQNHPLNITFNNDGICSGCIIHEEKDSLDWNERSEKLETILNDYKNKTQNNYDCIIPVSGGKDSYFIVDTIKNRYGLNPLLVTYNKHYNTDVGIRNLANLRIKFDCDIMTLTVSPETVKKITRATFRRFGSIYWHCIAGQTVYPVQIAVKFKIPLIIWGAHQGIDQVGMFSHLNEVEMTRKYRKNHDLMGYEAEDLISDFDYISKNDIKAYIYPDNKEIEEIGVRGIYLNNYIRWDSRKQHEEMIEKFDYETSLQTRTFDTYNDVDCWNYSDVHDFIKYVKHGYGKVTDHVNREIRLRSMTRDQGLSLINEFTRLQPKNLHLFLDWFGITENSFYYILNQHRNKYFWSRNKNWEWVFKNKLLNEFFEIPKQDINNNSKKFKVFINNNSYKSADSSDKYVLFGKGVQ